MNKERVIAGILILLILVFSVGLVWFVFYISDVNAPNNNILDGCVDVRDICDKQVCLRCFNYTNPAYEKWEYNSPNRNLWRLKK